jgi:hypothetical protein
MKYNDPFSNTQHIFVALKLGEKGSTRPLGYSNAVPVFSVDVLV